MQGLAIKNIAQILFRGLSFVRMHKCQERLANKRLGLFIEVTGEHGVEVYELEVGREKSPIYKGDVSTRRRKKDNAWGRAIGERSAKT